MKYSELLEAGELAEESSTHIAAISLASSPPRPPRRDHFRPLWIVKCIVHHPCKVMVVSMLLALIIAIIPLTQTIEIDKRTSSFRVLSDPLVEQYDAFREARSNTTRLDASDVDGVDNRFDGNGGEDDDDNDDDSGDDYYGNLDDDYGSYSGSYADTGDSDDRRRRRRQGTSMSAYTRAAAATAVTATTAATAAATARGTTVIASSSSSSLSSLSEVSSLSLLSPFDTSYARLTDSLELHMHWENGEREILHLPSFPSSPAARSLPTTDSSPTYNRRGHPARSPNTTSSGDGGDSANALIVTERGQQLGQLYVVYRVRNTTGSRSEDILLEPMLERIHTIEQKIMNAKGYDEHCQLQVKTTRFDKDGEVPLDQSDWKIECRPPDSLMNFFYPTLVKNATRHYGMYDVHDFDGRGKHMYPIGDIKNALTFGGDDFALLLDRRYNVWYRRSRVTRSVFRFGFPMKGFTETSGEQYHQQRALLREFVVSTYHKMLSEASTPELQVMYEGTELTEWEIDRLIYTDASLAIGSVALLFIWIWAHGRSVILSLAGLTHILVSIPCGYFVVRIVMQDRYLGILMCMALFIILGIGCDDIFILTDAWSHSLAQGPRVTRSLERRMDWTYRHAAGTMFVTSVTTASAFCANVISDMEPIRMFGIFMASIVIVNYLLVITWYPAVLVWWHLHIENRTWLCRKRDDDAGSRNDDSAHTIEDDSYAPGRGGDRENSDHDDAAIIATTTLDDDGDVNGDYDDVGDDDTSTMVDISLDDDGDEDEDGGLIVRQQQHETREGEGEHDVQQHPQKKHQHLPDIDRMGALSHWLYHTYVPTVHAYRWLVVVVFVALIGVGCYSIYNLTPEQGNPQFFPPGNNIHDLEETENTIFPTRENDYEDITVVWGVSTIDRSAAEKFNPQDRGRAVYDQKFDPSSPKAQQFLVDTFHSLANATDGMGNPIAQRVTSPCAMDGFATWRRLQNQTFPVKNTTEFWHSFRVFMVTHSSYRDSAGWSEDKHTLMYLTARYESYMTWFSPANKKQATYDLWTRAVDRENKRAPKGVARAYITNGEFVEMVTEEVLVRTAIFGVCASLAVAAFFLVLATSNILLSLYALLCIMVVVLFLAIFMTLAHWEVGIIESIALTIVVGLSVDFAVHICMSYAGFARNKYLTHASRMTLVQYSLADIGPSVLGGALTTASSVGLLFITTITFFTKFGQFVFVNILSSLFVSFTLLISLLLIAGPRGNVGVIPWRAVGRKLRLVGDSSSGDDDDEDDDDEMFDDDDGGGVGGGGGALYDGDGDFELAVLEEVDERKEM